MRNMSFRMRGRLSWHTNVLIGNELFIFWLRHAYRKSQVDSSIFLINARKAAVTQGR